MNLQLLVCLRCGGPLGKVASVPAIVECEFCAAVISIGGSAPVIARESTIDAKREAERKAARLAFIAAVNEMAAAKRDPYEALCEAAALHLGTAGQTDTLARIVFALARDFEAQNNVSVVTDGIVLARIAEGYFLAQDELRTATSYQINLPFLAADNTGPKHLLCTVDPTVLAELAQRDPKASPAAPASPAPAEQPVEGPRPKKKWWQIF